MSSALARSGRRSLILRDVDWPAYTRLLRAFAERPGIRLTYDRGVLEIMSPLHRHESDVDLLGRFVVVLTEELCLPIKAGRSTTLRRRRRQRGLEPDHSWWITNEPRVRGKTRVNLKVDPPPDLAIEVDVASSSLNRMAIYAALGVPEIWRLDEHGLTFQVLQPDGTYASSTQSLTFPLVTPADLMHFLPQRATLDENAVVRNFRDWVRHRIADASRPQT